MQQPKIKIFGQVYNVREIEFNKEGLIERIVYQVNEHRRDTVFRSDTVLDKSLTGEIKIQKPTMHPYFGYAYAPNLEKLIVK